MASFLIYSVTPMLMVIETCRSETGSNVKFEMPIRILSATVMASANCAVYCGAKPVFADIDLKTYNVAIDEIRKKINTQTRAVIPVHFAGQSCDMESIRKVIKNKEEEFGNKIFIIEDASHALGSFYKDKYVGSCAFSDMTVMSFHPVKHIKTGEGGAER